MVKNIILLLVLTLLASCKSINVDNLSKIKVSYISDSLDFNNYLLNNKGGENEINYRLDIWSYYIRRGMTDELIKDAEEF